MTSEPPLAATPTTVTDLANQLLPILAELDQVQNRQVELHRKSQKLTDKMLALTRSQARNWSDTRAAEIARLEASANSLQLKLGATQRNMARLRRRFEAALARFRTVFVNHDVQTADLQMGHARVVRQNAALDRSLRYMIRHMSQALLPEADDGYEVPSESHPYIPVSVSYFLDMLCRLDQMLGLDPAYGHPDQRYRPVSFLEVGSGSGRNMMLARSSEILLIDCVHGFDINPDQIAEGERLFNLGGALEVGDAMTFDYGGYDVVFSYRPFSDMDMQQALEAQMARTMSPGAYLMAPLSYDLALYPGLQVMDSHGDLWKKIG